MATSVTQKFEDMERLLSGIRDTLSDYFRDKECMVFIRNQDIDQNSWLVDDVEGSMNIIRVWLERPVSSVEINKENEEGDEEWTTFYINEDYSFTMAFGF